jgi:hypothetical protein
MLIITESEMSLERLEGLFASRGLKAEVKGQGSVFGELLEVTYPSGVIVIIWLQNPLDSRQLRFRTILIPAKARDRLDEELLNDQLADRNQQIEAYGALSTTNALGVTIEYRLPFKGGLLDETILSAAEGIATAAPPVLGYFELPSGPPR